MDAKNCNRKNLFKEKQTIMKMRNKIETKTKQFDVVGKKDICWSNARAISNNDGKLS